MPTIERGTPERNGFDDGPGFPPEIIGRIGEPYVKGHRPQRMQAASQSELLIGDLSGLYLVRLKPRAGN